MKTLKADARLSKNEEFENLKRRIHSKLVERLKMLDLKGQCLMQRVNGQQNSLDFNINHQNHLLLFHDLQCLKHLVLLKNKIECHLAFSFLSSLAPDSRRITHQTGG